MKKNQVVAFCGSLRKNSTNKGLLRTVVELAGDDMEVTVADIGSLPLYNQDLEAAYPARISDLKDQIRTADGILIATPEYNRSIPGVLKNMLDWTSRPYGDDAWAGKVVATLGVSPGGGGAGLAQYHLKQVLLYLNARVMGQPEFFVGNASEKFDQEGNLTDQKTREYIVRLLESFKHEMEKCNNK